jgi:hypothetical protein
MADTVYVVDAGLGLTTGFILAGGATEPHHIAWGTGSTPAATSDTGIETAPGEARTAGTGSQTNTGGTTNDTYQVVGTITATNTRAITEVALYTDASAGTCFLHGTFSTINLSTNDSIQFTIKAIYNQA